MHIIDLKRNLLRAYIWYLLEEVTVIPRKDYTLNLLDSQISLVVGEEKKLPRFVARILEKKDIVKISDEPQRTAVISDLIRLSQQGSQLQLQALEGNFYMRLAEALPKLSSTQLNELKPCLEALVSKRLLRIIHRFHTRNLEGLDLLEQMLLKSVLKLLDEFSTTILEDLMNVESNLLKWIEGQSSK
ncbi:MAG: hypothetical protein NDP13_00710 [Crenarchaeota archaeon]|nr:hypothetical protein [Thermoproteota archaeon]MCR8453506.1 hypothetical protein [Thermoproteota archaeon]MCR8454850.1 hypothetical protein [Thermoproteota archaeon]MCR8471104.1 hypothetical protein [Thermoproteota archaeon]MCR8471564.1 hypothetical protein [Thermoproteota archaeon]